MRTSFPSWKLASKIIPGNEVANRSGTEWPAPKTFHSRRERVKSFYFARSAIGSQSFYFAYHRPKRLPLPSLCSRNFGTLERSNRTTELWPPILSKGRFLPDAAATLFPAFSTKRIVERNVFALQRHFSGQAVLPALMNSIPSGQTLTGLLSYDRPWPNVIGRFASRRQSFRDGKVKVSVLMIIFEKRYRKKVELLPSR